MAANNALNPSLHQPHMGAHTQNASDKAQGNSNTPHMMTFFNAVLKLIIPRLLTRGTKVTH